MMSSVMCPAAFAACTSFASFTSFWCAFDVSGSSDPHSVESVSSSVSGVCSFGANAAIVSCRAPHVSVLDGPGVIDPCMADLPPKVPATMSSALAFCVPVRASNERAVAVSILLARLLVRVTIASAARDNTPCQVFTTASALFCASLPVICRPVTPIHFGY